MTEKVEPEIDFENLPFDEKLETPDSWTITDEVHLQFALLYRRPIGPDKDKEVDIIKKKFMTSAKKKITTEALWKKLCTFYNFEKLEERERSIIESEKEELNIASQKPTRSRRSTSTNLVKAIENPEKIDDKQHNDSQEALSRKTRSSGKITRRSDRSSSSKDVPSNNSITHATRRSTRR